MATPECLKLIRSILQLDWRKRPDAISCLMHELFSQFAAPLAINYK